MKTHATPDRVRNPGEPVSFIIATGAELVGGAVEDRNGPWLARAFASRGFPPVAILLVGDDEEAVVEGLETAARRGCSIAVVTGGLGPTADDVTRHAVARFAGVPIVEDPSLRSKIDAALSKRGRSATPNDFRQALLPAGSVVIPNPAGTADGFFVGSGSMKVVALPGPPAELVATAGPDLEGLAGALPAGVEKPALARLETFGLREAEVDGLLDDVRATGVTVGTLASMGCTSVVLSARGENSAQSVKVAADLARSRLGLHLFGEDSTTLEEALVALLVRKGITVATAESCTGGMIGELLTRVPGVSAVFVEGVVTYSNRSKTARLGVDEALIEGKGAVSAEVAESMALGACRTSGAALGLAVTGIAGPDGGTPEKPVGTVFLAASLRGETTVRKLSLGGMGRDWIRRIAAMSALDLGRRAVATP